MASYGQNVTIVLILKFNCVRINEDHQNAKNAVVLKYASINEYALDAKIVVDHKCVSTDEDGHDALFAAVLKYASISEGGHGVKIVVVLVRKPVFIKIYFHRAKYVNFLKFARVIKFANIKEISHSVEIVKSLMCT